LTAIFSCFRFEKCGVSVSVKCEHKEAFKSNP
jgi:hypothetical protein